MKRLTFTAAGSAILAAGMALTCAAGADFELTGPDGRRILLMDNGTWQYVEARSKDRDGEAILTLERKVERGSSCVFAVRLVNNHPYEIRSFVPYYSAYRADGVIYDTVSSLASFASMKPGDALNREFEFRGIACRDIVRLQVVGGDRCDMGDLDKYSAANGQCLARVRVVASELMPFGK